MSKQNEVGVRTDFVVAASYVRGGSLEGYQLCLGIWPWYPEYEIVGSCQCIGGSIPHRLAEGVSKIDMAVLQFGLYQS